MEKIHRYNLGVIYPRAIGLGLVIIIAAMLPILYSGKHLAILKIDYYVEHPIESTFVIIGWILMILIGIAPSTYKRTLVISELNKEILYGRTILFLIIKPKRFSLYDFQKVSLNNSNSKFSAEGSFVFTAISNFTSNEINLFLKNTSDKNKTLKIQNIGSPKKAEEIFNKLKVLVLTGE